MYIKQNILGRKISVQKDKFLDDVYSLQKAQIHFIQTKSTFEKPVKIAENNLILNETLNLKNSLNGNQNIIS